MQTILGAGGTIANNLAANLRAYTNNIRLVSRNPKPVIGDEQLVKADLLNPIEAEKAINGSEVVYLCVGLPYKTEVWQQQWPQLAQNVVNACLKSQSKLVFFDNVYALGLVNGWMTEESPLNPSSKKGEVRAQVLQIIETARQEKGLKALIARAPDFYGPATPLSFINVVVFDRLRKGKQAQWFVNPTLPHHIIYTPDAGRAVALLGNTDDCYNQTWHLPVDMNTITGQELVAMALPYFQAKPGVQVAPVWMIKTMGWFMSIMSESVELLYQFKFPYLFSCAKFNNRFPDFKVTTYGEGVRKTAEYYLAKRL
jgi:nucleoside-diphosphate-sugar epimerase